MLKYGGHTPIGKFLGKMLGKKLLLPDNFIQFDYIVPVPLHWRKLLSRGYNQSEVIARGIKEGLSGSGTDIAPQILPNLLCRKRFAASQTSKEREQRWRSVKDAYALNRYCRRVPGRGSHILLVDDVLTTGATLEACATILVEELGCRVSIATLAYVE
jgi:predicted amidophosphoribosyltransferase